MRYDNKTVLWLEVFEFCTWDFFSCLSSVPISLALVDLLSRSLPTARTLTSQALTGPHCPSYLQTSLLLDKLSVTCTNI